MRRLLGDTGDDGRYLIVTDGIRFKIIDTTSPDAVADTPEWGTLYWFLNDDPRGRPDWSGTHRMDFSKPNKMGKSDA